MSYYYGSIPIMYYSLGSGGGVIPPAEFLLLTDGTEFLITDGTFLKLAGT